MESKDQKFKRVAENRTNKIIHMINLLGNCSNKRVYDYKDSDVNKIFKAIEKSLDEAKAKFHQSKDKHKFKL